MTISIWTLFQSKIKPSASGIVKSPMGCGVVHFRELLSSFDSHIRSLAELGRSIRTVFISWVLVLTAFQKKESSRGELCAMMTWGCNKAFI
jgi:hypothetical protein